MTKINKKRPSLGRFLKKRERTRGRSPGLVVMGDDSYSGGRGFESQHCLLDVHDFFEIIVLFI